VEGRVSRDRSGLDILEYELVQEQAVALGRMGRALEAALDRLREFDAAHLRAEASERQARRALVTEAGKALWMFVVQREACGLRDSRSVMRDYNVPGEVLLFSGSPEPAPPLHSRRPRPRAPRVG
jgi:hypothetical protein